MIVVVDRIEGDMAVLEVGEHLLDWPLSTLPHDLREGDRLELQFTRIAADTDPAQARLDRLRDGGPDDDIIDL